MVSEPEDGSLKNAYTDVPELRDNSVLASLQILVWLFFHPSAWRNHIASVDPGLRPDFCLAELSRAQWCNPALRRLLLRGYVVGPLTLSLVMVLAMVLLGTESSDTAFGVSFVLSWGLTFGLAAGWVISLSAGLMGVVMAGLAVILIAVGQSETTIIFTSGIALGLVGGLVGHVTSRLVGRKPNWSLLRRIGRVVLCVLVGGLVAGLALYWAADVAEELEATRTSVSSTLAFGVAMGLAMGASLAVWFSVPYVLGNYFAGLEGGVVVSVVALGGPLSVILLLDGSIPVGAVLLGWLGVFIGLAGGVFGSLLFYPVLTCWIFLLYLGDKRRSGGRPSLLRWHPAFWDEFQRLPWLGLDRHLRLVWEQNPGEGQAALAYLADSRQRWTVQSQPNTHQPG